MSDEEFFDLEEGGGYLQEEIHHLSASKIADQFWCEMQTHLKLKYGMEPTEEMIAGSLVHSQLEEELAPVIEIEVITKEDHILSYLLQQYTKLSMLVKQGITRELPVIGLIGGFTCLGVIDQVELEEAQGDKNPIQYTVISDYKTRNSRRAPSFVQKRRNRVQLQIYWHLLQGLINGDYTSQLFQEYFEMDEAVQPSKDFLKQLPEELQLLFQEISPEQLLNRVFNLFTQLPSLSPELRAIYLHREDRQVVHIDRSFFHLESFKIDMEWAIDYWKGERMANDCPQQWMCRYCQFTDECPYFLSRYLRDEE
ncbi:MAG: hypothetical protein GF308_13560 [Candidatus Heimdallarchaeota archaeon]|nr:hypothetical protein [Candidatus Heimdallarchaeota archaeon]